MGIAVSTMAKPEEDELVDSEKSVYHWCQEGKIDEVKKRLQEEKINQLDEEVGLVNL